MNSNKLLFSIIIPTFNSAKTLAAALDSIINQNYKNYEILIIDGKSTDQTLKIAQNYFDSRIIIYSEPDRGIYDAMNKGIKLSKGEWLYFMGSDDQLLNKNTLLLINESIKEYYGKKIIYGNVLIDGKVNWRDAKKIYDGMFDFDKLIKKNICHQSIFYHSSIFKSGVKYDTRYTVCADWDLNLKFTKKYNFQYIDQTIAIFKGGNTSSNIKSNYSEIDKWITIFKTYKTGILAKKFKYYPLRFKLLGKKCIKEGLFIKGIIFYIVCYSIKLKNR